MVSRDSEETALFVALAVVGFLLALGLGASDVVAGVILFGVSVVAPLVRDEWRRRQAD